ncbi:MAG: TraR/DksA C4-type zinc finger protein [Bacteroidetes bacterium]|jgi:RNA polymerase-binding protein DksA|nr:TraR/DksA C4-type zinc finger protein [Bacteroidota bacterium]
MAKKTTKKTAAKSTKAATKKRAAPKRPSAKPASKPARAAAKAPVAAARVLPKKGYGKRELEYFRTIITEKRKEILEELESLKASMMDVQTGEYANESSTYSLHMEQGTDAMEREKVFLFASREGKFLNYLDDALQRIENGSYGFCTDCGKLIEKERLEAVPHAQQCVQCKLKKGAGNKL